MAGNLVVVGAGVVGATMAMEGARRGWSTVVLEAADDVGAGCSYANAALLAPEHVTPLATPALLRDAVRQLWRRPSAVRIHPDPTVLPWLARLAVSAWRTPPATAVELRALARRSADSHARWHDEGLSRTYRRIGALDVWLRGRGPRQPLAADRLRRLEPSLGVVAGGAHHADEAITESRSYVGEMLAEARRHGADVRFGHPVRDLVTGGGRVVGVRVADSVVAADHVVVCTGLAAGSLASRVGLRIPLRGGRGYVVDLQPSADTPRMAVRFPEHRVVVTPLADRVRVAGSMEFGAERRAWDTERARSMVAVAARGIPSLAGRPVIDVWAGERPCTSDGLPVIGMTRQVDGLSFAVGHGMWGLVLAPVTAELVLDGIGVPAATGPFAPDRFASRPR